MEMQLKSTSISYLEPVAAGSRNLEQTQQIRLPDGMPGPPWEGTHRHYLSQVPGGDPYQELNRSCCKARFL